MTPSSASPVKPILPGVPVPFPCWAYTKYHPSGKEWVWFGIARTFSDAWTHWHPDQPEAPTADPATFSKVDTDTIVRNLSACLDNRDRLAKLTPAQLIEATLESDAADYDVVIELMNRVLPNWTGLPEKTIEAASPGAGTEQKERGGASKELSSNPHDHGMKLARVDDNGMGVWEPAPTDGTTTPRSDAKKICGEPYHDDMVPIDFARQLERELNAAKADALDDMKAGAELGERMDELKAHLALTEKRLGEEWEQARQEKEHHEFYRSKVSDYMGAEIKWREAVETFRSALAQAKQEVEIVTGKLAIEREHQSSLRTANTALSAQVEELKQKLYKAEERVDSLTDPEERPAPPIKNNFPSINVSSTGEAPGSLLDV